MERYYYKQNGTNNFLNLKTPLNDLTDYTEITEKEFNAAQEAKKHIPTEEKIAKREKVKEIAQCKARLRELDYIGVKIATGRATVGEYAEQIAEMQRLADRINELENEIDE